MINILELLKNAPQSMKLYSPIYGDVEFKYIEDGRIIVKDKYGFDRIFSKYGEYVINYDSECLLFPSKDCRSWEEWSLSTKPKFKNGDWLISDVGNIYQLIGISDDRYELIDTHLKTFSVPFSFDGNLRKWALADIKYGNVLANTAGCILIAKDNESCLCYIDKNGEFHAYNNKWFFANFSDNTLTPATKEQRELLFHKMKEAGYEWDSCKKKLRKIKQHYDIGNFKPGMPVLVRETSLNTWQYTLFSHCYIGVDGLTRFNAGLIGFTQCIPFNENTKYLLGTTDMCPEEYINW